MLNKTAYCSARDTDVHVLLTDAVCLDFGQRCTGAMCPMFGLPSIMMGVRLARSGLRPDAFRTLTAHCRECNETVDLQIVNDEYTYCPVCGSRSRWIRLQIGDEDFIALAGAG